MSLRPAEQFETMEQQEHADMFGMWVFLGSETLLFAGLLTLYGAYRTMYGTAFSTAASLNDVTIGTVNTAVLLTSSLTVAMSVHSVRLNRPRRASLYLAGSIVLGIAFLVLKGIEYAAHIHEGLSPGASYHNEAMPGAGPRTFIMIYYLLTGLHALHVIAGLCVLGWIFVRCRQGAYSAERHAPLEMGGLYWHTIDILWIFLWPLLYLAK